DPTAPNYGWAFDGVPEENSVIFDFAGTELEVPATDVVFFQPDALLGPRVHARFGAEFPIRFDFLDTMGGQNLSLQVHPLTEYAQDRFGIHYTQDESYYILDATERSCVYLGVRTGTSKDELVGALRRAERGEESFDDARYINCFPVRKHDHMLIPAGTIHAAGPDTVVLEISATP
ncbi:TPA: class I mannose-6-phosphate isomerase, partial [Clostridioides difficile]|nr:class I mannose-6-phosphate isomerase [Clostridioides difficile]